MSKQRDPYTAAVGRTLAALDANEDGIESDAETVARIRRVMLEEGHLGDGPTQGTP